jgi:hypothetical protein
MVEIGRDKFGYYEKPHPDPSQEPRAVVDRTQAVIDHLMPDSLDEADFGAKWALLEVIEEAQRVLLPFIRRGNPAAVRQAIRLHQLQGRFAFAERVKEHWFRTVAVCAGTPYTWLGDDPRYQTEAHLNHMAPETFSDF